eukprot:6477519-Amphidinium_carterae.2
MSADCFLGPGLLASPIIIPAKMCLGRCCGGSFVNDALAINKNTFSSSSFETRVAAVAPCGPCDDLRRHRRHGSQCGP